MRRIFLTLFLIFPLSAMEERTFEGEFPFQAVNESGYSVTVDYGSREDQARLKLKEIALSFVLRHGERKRFLAFPKSLLNLCYHDHPMEQQMSIAIDFGLTRMRFSEEEDDRFFEISPDYNQLLKPLPQKNYFVFQNFCFDKSIRILFLEWGKLKRVTYNIKQGWPRNGSNAIPPDVNCIIIQCIEERELLIVCSGVGN